MFFLAPKLLTWRSKKAPLIIENSLLSRFALKRYVHAQSCLVPGQGMEGKEYISKDYENWNMEFSISVLYLSFYGLVLSLCLRMTYFEFDDLKITFEI